MALVKCRECGEAVSEGAGRCPKCGAFAPNRTNWILYLIVAWAVIGGVVWMFLARGN